MAGSDGRQQPVILLLLVMMRKIGSHLSVVRMAAGATTCVVLDQS
jgi:hypothetical protein